MQPALCKYLFIDGKIILTRVLRAQYANLFGVIGRIGPNGLNTVFLNDLRRFYIDEDLPTDYGRRELPYYSPEANSYIDRMTHHIGFQIERPWPPNDQDGRDVEPVAAKFET